jgi:predicted outer membrane repeat protein
MYNASSSPTLANLTFHGNSATLQGGGMYNHSSSPTLTNVTFIDNTAGSGGGMQNEFNSNPTLANVTFSGNSASYYGSGMHNYDSSPTLTNVTFSGNSAGYGGGGMRNSSSSPTLTNVTFTGNSAGGNGGGIYNYNDSNPAVGNAIFWGNTAPAGPQVFNENSSTPSLSGSIVQGGCPTSSTCTQVVDADPLLGALGDWGGWIHTIPLLPGSSAIDAGYGAACPATDARGVARPQGAGCDIGAFESRGFTLEITGGGGQSTPLNTPFTEPLTLSISSAYGEPVGGGAVTFEAPTSGASASPSTSSVTIAGGVVSLSLSANHLPGSYPVVAAPSGVTTPAYFILTNTRVPTATTITSSANPSVSGQGLTLTAVVSGTVSEATLTGTVTFTSDGADLPGCSAVLLVDGQASCSFPNPALGAHELRTAYSGDAVHAASSATITQDVNPASTTTLIAASPNPSLAGKPVTLTVTVSPVTPGSGTPTGTVELFEVMSPSGLAPASHTLFPAQPLLGGTATFPLTALPPGSHTLRALYHGDDHFLASASAVFTQAVDLHACYLPLLAGGP